MAGIGSSYRSASSFYATGKLLTNAIHLAVNRRVKRREPLVINHERFYFGFAELAVVDALVLAL